MEWLLIALGSAFLGSFADNLINSETATGGTRMLGGLPVEMITMLGSSLLGGAMTIWGQSIKAKQQQQVMLMERAKFQMSAIEKARAYDNKGFQWTRRIIALIAVFFIIVWPKIVPVIFDVSVFLTWTELSRGFLFLIIFPLISAKCSEPSSIFSKILIL